VGYHTKNLPGAEEKIFSLSFPARAFLISLATTGITIPVRLLTHRFNLVFCIKDDTISISL
jgi:hypothetical protein